ncbi:MAG: MliC family protein [Desulfatibacillaceae bacterium]|nr:MliC family protein [Desulfatibacillaceae bacterium]
MKKDIGKDKNGPSPKKSVLNHAFALACICIMATVFLTACSALQTGLAVKGGQLVTYLCQDDAVIEVRYFHLDDKSLNFVKITLPDGSAFTLPQVLSASGARYTDDGPITSWAKGDGGFVEIRDENGLWRILHADCKRIPPDNK